MRPVSSRFLAAIGGSVARVVEVTATAPDDTTPTDVLIDSGSFNVNPDSARFTASLNLTPDTVSDLYGLVSTPGTVFKIRSGVRYGGPDIEWTDCGVYEATSGNSSLTIGEIPLGLTDGFARLERCRFAAPWAASAGSRADAIEAIVLDASPDVDVVKLTSGGTMPLTVFDRDRLDAISQIAKAGSIDAAFNAVGQFVIRDAPVVTPTAPVWTAKTGALSNILDTSRNMGFDRLYNTVVVVPVDDTQTWSVQTIELADAEHPRYKSKIGVVPFFYTSPLVTSMSDAQQAGRTILQQLLTSTDRVQVTALGNPALEAGDTVSVIHSQTATDPGIAGSYLVEGYSFDLFNGNQEITSRSTSLAELQES